MAEYSNISETSLKSKTGKDWQQWIDIIDKFGGATMSHKQIAAKLSATYGQSIGGWWCQSITVGYEYAKGRRVLGQTKDTGFQVGVSKKLPIAPDKLWSLITEPAGLKIWLGQVKGFKLTPGAKYKTLEGTTGEIRTFALAKRIRLTWQPYGWPKPAVLQLSISVSGQGSVLGFHQEKLSGTKQREVMRSHWKDILLRLEKLIEKA